MPPSPTHFLCIPVNCSPQLATSLASFRADVTSPLSFGFPAESVRPMGTMHLTLGVMTLTAAEGDFEASPRRTRHPGEAENGGRTVHHALNVLKGIKLNEVLRDARRKATEASKLAGSAPRGHDGEPVSKGEEGKLKITLQGLRSMGPANKTSVLYAPPVDPGGILYRFCETLRQKFQDEGLMIVESRPLLLHATVLNMIYVRQRPDGGKRSGGRGRGGGREKPTIDATQVVDRYQGYEWMENWVVARVNLCRMGAKKGDDGEERYVIEGTVEF